MNNRSQPSMVSVRIKQSKTDPFRKRVTLFLGCTGTNLYPMTAILAYLAMRPPSMSPLFIFHDGRCLTRAHLVEQLQRALQKAGIDPGAYSSHSF